MRLTPNPQPLTPSRSQFRINNPNVESRRARVRRRDCPRAAETNRVPHGPVRREQAIDRQPMSPLLPIDLERIKRFRAGVGKDVPQSHGTGIVPFIGLVRLTIDNLRRLEPPVRGLEPTQRRQQHPVQPWENDAG